MYPVPLRFVADMPHSFMAGLDAQQAVVFAQLGIRGKSYGVHGFLVPLRNEVPQAVTHQLCPASISAVAMQLVAAVRVLRLTSDRSVQDMTPYPNVRVQDQGAKMGANGVENGVSRACAAKQSFVVLPFERASQCSYAAVQPKFGSTERVCRGLHC